jgi:ribosome-binding protein aMBF1 (putative translation factor)
MKKKNFILFDDYLEEMLKDPLFKEAYDALEVKYAIISSIIRLRNERGLTQAQLAEKMGTKQAALSRMESGNYNPSVKFLEKLAKGLDAKLTITFT